MVRDGALSGAFMSLFASFGGIVRVLVRPDCHHSGHQNHRQVLLLAMPQPRLYPHGVGLEP